jgi:hypothetical protein
LTAGRRLLLLSLPFAAVVSAIAWISGPPEFDFLDGTEFALCSAGLNIPHPPGYPLFMFLLKAVSPLLPGASLDYGCLRMVTAFLAAAGTITGAFVLAGLGAGVFASLLGSFLFFTLGTVMDQLNLLEVHGLSILLVLAALRLRSSRCGPYMLSLSIFGGHPVSALLAPALWSRRCLQRWGLLAAIPASLWLFVPVRSTFDALCHYSHPGTLYVFWKYLTLYGGKFTSLSSRAADALFNGTGPLSLAVLLAFILLSGRVRWRLLASFLAGFIFLSFYFMGDTNSLMWVPLLPLCIWAADGIRRLASRGRAAGVLAAAMVAVSAVSGTVRAWRADDISASILARDMTRGVGFEGVYITIGFLTFNTAYLLDVLDFRPDILPMDEYECYFRIPPPPFYPAQIAGRDVYTNRGWDQAALSPGGLLFSATGAEVDWTIYDVFTLDGPIHDRYSMDEIRDVWLKRLLQITDPVEFQRVLDASLRWWDYDELGERINRLYTRGFSRISIDDLER